MFTGIISGIGQITEITPLGNTADSGFRLWIKTSNFDLSNVKVGDSIALQGACMTVVDLAKDSFAIEISRESLNCTCGLDKIAEVNLEHAMRLGDTLDGHLVSGHVDGVGEVLSFNPVGESHELRIQVPLKIRKYLAYKGSVVVNGVSLTVNQLSDNDQGSVISINIIPHTIEVTTLKHLKARSLVNLEVDLIARYVERILSLDATASK